MNGSHVVHPLTVIQINNLTPIDLNTDSQYSLAKTSKKMTILPQNPPIFDKIPLTLTHYNFSKKKILKNNNKVFDSISG